jgi:hypothetical protein
MAAGTTAPGVTAGPRHIADGFSRGRMRREFDGEKDRQAACGQPCQPRPAGARLRYNTRADCRILRHQDDSIAPIVAREMNRAHAATPR